MRHRIPVLLAALVFWTGTTMADHKTPQAMRRIKSMREGDTEEQYTEKRKDRRMRKQEHIRRVLEKVGTPDKLGFLNKAKLDNIEPLALFKEIVESEAMEPLYRNVEMIHRLVESVPLMKTIPGFRGLTRKLSDEETVTMFKIAMKTLLEFGKTAVNNAKSPDKMADLVRELAQSSNSTIQDTVQRARAGDVEAQREVQRMVTARSLPGFDYDAFRSIHENMNFDYMLSQPEFTRFLDYDPYVSDLVRNGMSTES